MSECVRVDVICTRVSIKYKYACSEYHGHIIVCRLSTDKPFTCHLKLRSGQRRETMIHFVS